MKKKITVALCLQYDAIVCGVIVSGVTLRTSSANISISTDSQTVKKEAGIFCEGDGVQRCRYAEY